MVAAVHDAPLLVPPHATISQNAQQDCTVKTKNIYNYYSLFYLLVIMQCGLCVFVLVELTYQHKS